MARRFQKFSLRFVFEFTFVIAAGLAGCQSVYSGEANQWPGFNVRQGYWGTNFLGSYLYAMGNDTAALIIVSALWFVYATLLAIGLVLIMRLCFRRGRSTHAQ